MRPLPRLALCVAALLSACSRDLDVPEPTTAPTIEGFGPLSAYAGERVTIAGAGFDPDPQANLVQFARASARAESAAPGSITVRVPADAGTGPLTVTTDGGMSAPASSFTYRGLGELRARAIASQLSIVHRPYRLVAGEGETFLHSDLVLGLLRYGSDEFAAATAVSMDSAAWAPEPSVVWLEGREGGSRIVRQPLPSGAPVPLDVDDAAFGPIVAVRGDGGARPDAVAVLRHDLEAPYATTLALHDLSDLAPLAGYETPVLVTRTAFQALRGCVDAGSGQLACVVREGLEPVQTPWTIARISLAPSPSVAVLVPPPVPLAVTGTPPDLPICADPATRDVVVPLQDGTLAVVDADTLEIVAVVETGSRTPARSVACPGGDAVLVSKRGDDLLTRVDLTPGTVVWSAYVPKASHADVDRSGTPWVVHAVGEDDNVVRLLDADDGSLLALRSFDVLPGRVHAPDSLLDRTAMQGAAWYDEVDAPPHLAFVTSTPRGIITWPLTAQRAAGLFPQFLDYADATGVAPWNDSGGIVPVREQRFLQGTLQGTAQLALDAPAYVHFATTAGLETLDWVDGMTTTALSTIASPEFTSLGYLPDARIFAAVRSGSAWTVRAWTADEALTGGAAGSTWPSPPSTSVIAAAAVLDGELWAFYWDPPGDGEDDQLHAVGLSDALATRPLSDAVLPDVFYSILAVSPNGRTFVSWDFQPYVSDTSVVVWSADAALGFPRLATIPVEGQVAGVAFDGTGERLYVVTRGPDRIVVLE